MRSGAELYDAFSGAAQEPVRLACALEGFLRAADTTPGQREVLGRYLKRRIRAASEALLDADDAEALARLAELGWLEPPQLERLLRLASEQGRTACLVWLLHRKEETYGYEDRDFSL